MGVYDETGEYKDDPALRAVHLSVEVEAFTKTRLGKHVLQKADECRESAVAALLTAPNDDPQLILQLQYQAKIPDLFRQWLKEAFEIGIAVEQDIKFEKENQYQQ